MISWLRRLRNKYRHDKTVVRYYEIGTAIGKALSLAIAHPWVTVRGKEFSVYDPELYHLLDELEEAYASLGYRIIQLHDWIDHGGWGIDIGDLWLVEREDGERPQYTKLYPRPELPQLSVLLQMHEE